MKQKTIKRNEHVEAKRVGKGPCIQHIHVGRPLNDEGICKRSSFVFFALYTRCIYRFKWSLEKATPYKRQCNGPTIRTSEEVSVSKDENIDRLCMSVWGWKDTTVQFEFSFFIVYCHFFYPNDKTKAKKDKKNDIGDVNECSCTQKNYGGGIMCRFLCTWECKKTTKKYAVVFFVILLGFLLFVFIKKATKQKNWRFGAS